MLLRLCSVDGLVPARLFRLPALLLWMSFCLPGVGQDFVGSEVCAGCHQSEWDSWQQSHHASAMADASAASVLGDFSGVDFESQGVSSRFLTRDGDYFVETQDASGDQKRFRITHTLGFMPLQQYLVETQDGRLQALSVAWDSRPEAEGGQRWFHLYPDELIAPDEPLHWTGAFQNGNSRCIGCHTTGYEKHYDRQTDSYESRWQAVNVGCEACHGPGANHLAWAEAGLSAPDSQFANAGLVRSLDSTWTPEVGERPVPDDDPALIMNAQIASCAGCHSRRRELQPVDPFAEYHDNYLLSPLREGLYHADGQIRDEVYVIGSFLQSRMFREHVSCGNCHEPHSNALRVEGNGLCLQCHEAAAFQNEDHLLHNADSAGAQCVNCHMPETTYMQVDPRRDHSLRIPDPFASVEVGTPNACTGCHKERDPQWAADVLSSRTGREGPYYSHTEAIAAARRGQVEAALTLRSLADDPDNAGMIRSIALIESARFPSQQHLRVVLGALDSADPMVRASAAMALDFLDPVSRLQYLEALLDDPAKAVRMTVAQQLSAVPAAQVSAQIADRFRALMTEYENSLLANADMPESMNELGRHYAARGDLVAATQTLRHARRLSPGYLPAMLNLADVYRAQGRDVTAEPILDEALRRYPDSGDAHHALGLLYVRTGRTPRALALFRKAAQLAPDNVRYALVYGLALMETGSPDEAVRVLEAAGERFPGHSGIRSTLESLRNR